MNELPNPDDQSALPVDPPPGSDPDTTPRVAKPPQPNHNVRPETLATNPKVTPLDEDKNIQDGIEINET